MELALHHGEGPVMMQSIADSQGVSRKYLDTIFTNLKSAGLVRSRRGIGGGHMLGKAPETIRLGDVLRALEGPLALVDCVSSVDLCSRSHRCVTRDVWREVGQAVEGVLDNITVADLVQRHYSLTGKEEEPSEPDPEGEACELDKEDPAIK